MDLELAGRRVAVTGASSGIGRAVALTLGAEGARLALGARRPDRLDETVAAVGGAGAGDVFGMAADMAEEAGVRRLVDEAVRRYGGLDALVCCVGSTPLGSFESTDDDTWHRAWEGKVLATIRALRVSLPHLRRSDSGRAVILAGNSTYDPDPIMVTSAVANAALGALTACVAREFAREGVGVVCVDPGPTDTSRFEGLVQATAAAGSIDPASAAAALRDRVPTGRIAAPEEIAAVVAFCVSTVATHMTGTRVVVDGAATWTR